MAARARTTKAGKAAPRAKSTRAAVEKREPLNASRVRNLTARQKLLVIAGVLFLGYLVFVAKDILVAATVNGRPVSRLSVVRELERQGGRQVLDGIINEVLIEQEARKAGVVVSDSDIGARIDELSGQMAEQGQDLDSVLELQGMSQEDLRKQIRIQLFIEKLLEDKIEITDEEVDSFIETNTDFLPEMEDAELREFAKGELRQQKISTQFSTWLSEVKANSSINYFVEY